LGELLVWGNTSRPSAGSVLHLFFGNLQMDSIKKTGVLSTMA